jgi:microcystin-dependent protein
MPLTLASNAITFTDNTSLSSGIITTPQLSADVRQILGIPVGSVMSFAMSGVPAGWLPCNGASLATNLYPALFNVIQYMHGGSGVNFNLPDLRGEFIRGWSEARAVDTGRAFGSAQADELRSHSHTLVGANNTTGAGLQITRMADNMSNYQSGSFGGSETRPRNVALLYCIKWN